jgi:hypothetical protein
MEVLTAFVRGHALCRLLRRSYPIIREGLVYVVDVRNGLYVLRYTGAHAAEVAGLIFLVADAPTSR